MQKLTLNMSVGEMEAALTTCTIFDKIEFSGISKDAMRTKLKDLRERQVPNRSVLLHLPDEEVVFYWFKNWLHPSLKHAVPLPPKDTRGCSAKVLERDTKISMLHFFENGQQNFQYTLVDIDAYLEG